eukprot:Gb_05706 [translate_table: standard]
MKGYNERAKEMKREGTVWSARHRGSEWAKRGENGHKMVWSIHHRVNERAKEMKGENGQRIVWGICCQGKIGNRGRKGRKEKGRRKERRGAQLQGRREDGGLAAQEEENKFVEKKKRGQVLAQPRGGYGQQVQGEENGVDRGSNPQRKRERRLWKPCAGKRTPKGEDDRIGERKEQGVASSEEGKEKKRKRGNKGRGLGPRGLAGTMKSGWRSNKELVEKSPIETLQEGGLWFVNKGQTPVGPVGQVECKIWIFHVIVCYGYDEACVPLKWYFYFVCFYECLPIRWVCGENALEGPGHCTRDKAESPIWILGSDWSRPNHAVTVPTSNISGFGRGPILSLASFGGPGTRPSRWRRIPNDCPPIPNNCPFVVFPGCYNLASSFLEFINLAQSLSSMDQNHMIKVELGVSQVLSRDMFNSYRDRPKVLKAHLVFLGERNWQSVARCPKLSGHAKRSGPPVREQICQMEEQKGTTRWKEVGEGKGGHRMEVDMHRRMLENVEGPTSQTKDENRRELVGRAHRTGPHGRGLRWIGPLDEGSRGTHRGSSRGNKRINYRQQGYPSPINSEWFLALKP